MTKNELTPEYLFSLINGNAEKIKALERSTVKNTRSIQDIEEEYPLLPPESDELSNVVKKKGVEILGGKNTSAYKNVALRKKVYQDIYLEIKRQYGLIDEAGRQMSYKKLKRKYLKGAMSVVEAYQAPIALENEILEANELDEMCD